LAAVAPLATDQPDGPAAATGGFEDDPEEFIEEQSEQ